MAPVAAGTAGATSGSRPVARVRGGGAGAPALAACLAVPVLLACAGSSPSRSLAVQPRAVLSDMAAEAKERTRPRSPVVITFRWRAREPDFRGSGFGVARVEPPYRARLDLFLDNGETAAIAALVDDEVRIPPSLPYGLVPAAPMLWAALGVFRPGPGAEVVEGRAGDGAARIVYALPDGGRARFDLGSGGLMEGAELLDGRGSAVQSVYLEYTGEPSYPSRAVYRHLSDVRELSLALESIEDAESFAAEIWTPGARPDDPYR